MRCDFYEWLTGTGYPIVSDDHEIQAKYVAMRRKGEGHSIAEMLALQQPPCPKTDATFFAAQDEQYNDPTIRHYRELAEAAGVDVNGAKYFSGLADYAGDVRAWKRSRGEIVDHCERNGQGLTISGEEKVKPRLDTPPVDVPMDDDMIEDRLLDWADANPELEAECEANPKKFRQVVDEAKESLAAHWDKKAA